MSILVTINPTSNTTPDPGQATPPDDVTDIAVVSATNTGHGASIAESDSDGNGEKATCLWSGFVSPGVTPALVKLKVDWTEVGSINISPPAINEFKIEYSLNGGSSWSTLHSASNVVGFVSSSSEVTLSNAQDFSQVRVRDSLLANSGVGGPDPSSDIETTVSNIRIEIEYNPAPKALLSSMA
jgi:hypothetical protein